MRRWIWLAVSAVLLFRFRHTVMYIIGLLCGGALLALLIYPLTKSLERMFGRMTAIFAAWGIMFAAVAGLVLLLVPVIRGQIETLCAAWPQMQHKFCALLVRTGATGFSGKWLNELPDLFAKVGLGVGQVATSFASAGIMWVLSLFFLKDRERYLLMLELLLPLSCRRNALMLIRRIMREVRLLVSGQIKVAGCIAVLVSAGLLLARVKGAVLLGIISGVCNMIPYFGPIVAAVPVVLVALTDGWVKALIAGGVLILVQQIDGFLISPRVLSGATGITPVCVILSVAAGGAAFGIIGMVFALPGAIVIRILYSEWAKHRKTPGPIQN